MADKSKMLDRNRLGAIGIALAVVLFFAVNILAGALLKSTRLDLTEDKLFTLSDGTKRVLSTMEEPVDLRLYYSDRLDESGPYFSAHARRVEELLGEYQRRSGGRLHVERLDPQAFSPEEDLAVAEGLEGLPLSADGTKAYFGLSGRNSTDDIKVISYFAPERANFLEYDLTRLVNDLANPEKPVVALLGDMPLMGTQFDQYQPWHVLEAMYQFFDVRVLGGKQEHIDDDVQVLMLAQPHNVDPATLYAIDQFVMRGGRVLAFIDPLAEVMAAGGGMNPMATPEGDAIKALEPLLAAWGITIPDGQVIGDRMPGTTTTGMASNPISFASCSANSSSIRESGMSCAAKPTFTFFPAACSLMKPSAKRLSHFEPNDVEQKISGFAGGNASRGHTPPPKSNGIFSVSDSVMNGLYVAEVDALIMRIEPSASFLALAAARCGSPRSSSYAISTFWPLIPPASFTRLKYAL